jgi:GT2 family glycosyltransferase
MNRVAVVVINYKGIDDTIRCLAALAKQTYAPMTIILVENGSQDGSTETIKTLEKKYGKKLVTIYHQQNLGFTGGANAGMRWAIEHDFDGVALLNNDAVADTRWLESLVASHTRTKAGITTSLLLHEHGDTIDSTGDWYSIWGLPFPRNRGDLAAKAPAAGFVFGATGGASLYDIRMLREIGLFDDTFFAYYEDVDISFRTQLAGWKVYYEPAAIAYHKQGATSKKMPGFAVRQTFKNLPLVYLKNVPRGLLFSIGIRFWCAYAIMLAHAIKKGSAKPAISGYFQSIGLFWTSALSKRWSIQASKKVTTNYIRTLLWPDLPPDQTGMRKLRRFFTGK